ncbi:MAG: hypothetical protein LBB57_02925 [Clostridiales Family XIII bacterium]|jgi:hypothetical protein|nr:hypothetical protein [Clostridiales Family XIII bacterium]
MIFYAGDMVLEPVREVFDGPKNGVSICRDLQSPIGAHYVLLRVKDRTLARRLIAIFEHSERILSEGVSPYVACFTQNELLCYLFDYREERRIGLFAPGQIGSSAAWESVCVNLVLECLSSPIPFPLLSLSLAPDNVHLEKDGAIFFTPYYDLSQLSDADDESVCARRCVELMLSLLPTKGHLKSAELMRKKLLKSAFRSLPELYRDIKVTELPKKRKFKAYMADLWRHNKDRLFSLMLVLCVIAAIFAVIVLLSQLIFGNVPILRIFERCFDVIGLRSLR